MLTLVWLSLAVACSGDEREALSAEEYFKQLVRAGDEIDGDGNDVEQRVNDALASGTESQLVSAYRAFFDESIPLTQQFVEDVQELRPPAEIEQEHEEYLSVLERVLEAYVEMPERLKGVTARSELEAILTEDSFEGLFVDGNRTCLALQGVADHMGIDANLRCT